LKTSRTPLPKAPTGIEGLDEVTGAGLPKGRTTLVCGSAGCGKTSSLQSPFLLAVRLYWGWQLIETGWGKLTDIGKVIGFFSQLGIPAPALNAYFVSALESEAAFF
jgi:hypothetical protein